MEEKFIENDQYNYIVKQISTIQDSMRKHVDPAVLTAVKDLAQAKILDLFPNATREQQEILDISKLSQEEEYEHIVTELAQFLKPFPRLTEQQLKKLFPKVKKLKLPDLDSFNYKRLTYLSWNDTGANKKFVVYKLEGKLVGMECKLTPNGKHNICSFCNGLGKVSYFSTVTKKKMAKNPDYYRSTGNFVCIDGEECNRRITNTDYLNSFIKDSLGE